MYSTCCSVSPLGYCDLNFLCECALGLAFCGGGSEECGEALLDGVFVLSCAEGAELELLNCDGSGGGDTCD